MHLTPKGAFVDVTVLEAGEEKNLGGPTNQDGEQWFGGFVWCENGKHMKAATHYAVKATDILGKDSEFRVGRGSGIVFQSAGKGPLETTRVQSIQIEKSTFYAPLRIGKARSICLLNSTFHGDVSVGEYATPEMKGHTHKGKPFRIREEKD